MTDGARVRGRERIGSGEYIWISAAGTIAGSVYLWPQHVLAVAGTDAPYALLLAWGAAVALARWTVSPKRQAASSGRLARLSAVLVTLEMLTVLCVSVELFSALLRTFFLPRAPNGVLTVLMVATAVWLASRPLEGLVRTVQFWFPLLLLSLGIVAVASLRAAPWLAAALPSPDIALKPIGQGALVCWYLWISGSVPTQFARFLRNPGEAPRLVSAAFGIQVIVVLIMYVMVLANTGPYATVLLKWPLITVVNNAKFNEVLLSSVGMVLGTSWTIAILIYMAVHLRGLASHSAQAWRLSSTGHTTLAWVFGAGLAAALVALPWERWALSDVLVFWLGPIDLIRVGALVVPMTWLQRSRLKGVRR